MGDESSYIMQRKLDILIRKNSAPSDSDFHRDEFVKRAEKKRTLLNEYKVENWNWQEDASGEKSGCITEAQTTAEISNVIQKKSVVSGSKKEKPSLYECAEALKRKVHLMSYRNKLYYFNGYCYDIVQAKDVIRLYRKHIDLSMADDRNMSSFKQLHDFLCTDVDIEVDDITISDGHTVVFKNGVYDVMKGKLYHHSPDRMVFSYINASFSYDTECPVFESFLDDITQGNKNLRTRMWMVLSYVLMQTNEGKCFVVMGEAPNSGKSLFGNFIEKLYDNRYVSNVPLDELSESFGLDPLVGKAVNISLDLCAKLNLRAVSRLKMLTGGDTVNVNKKYVDMFEYENRAKLIFASNYPLRLVEKDDAFWDRVVYIPFNRSIPPERRDRHLLEKLLLEKDAIVSKAMKYARKLIERNYEFPTTPEIENRLREWRGERNMSIESFVGDCCRIGEEFRGELVDNLYSSYKAYCESGGFNVINRVLFKQFLEKKYELEHFKMRDGGENPQSAFRNIYIIN